MYVLDSYLLGVIDEKGSILI